MDHEREELAESSERTGDILEESQEFSQTGTIELKNNESNSVPIDLCDKKPPAPCFASPFLRLYASQGISCWGDRMWGFVVPIYFVDIFPTTLLPAALFELVTKTVAVFVGPYVGDYVDRMGRLTVIRTSLISENLGVFLTTICLILLSNFRTSDIPPYSDPLFALLFAIIMILGAVSNVASMACGVAISKDWTVAMANGDSKILTRMNAIVRQVSLAAEIAAPLFCGILLSTTTASVSLIFIATWNLFTFFPELWLLESAYKMVPSLSAPKERKESEKKPGMLKSLLEGYKLYFRQRAFLPSLAYVFLYMTVLCPGAMLTAFMKSQGVSEGVIGVFRGLSAIAGLSATIAGPKMITKFGLVKAGVVSVWTQWGALFPAVFCFLIPNVGIYLFLLFLIVSRFGLWSFDLVEVQIMQTYVPLEVIGSVNAVETALTNFTSIVSYAWGVMVPDPRDFWILIMLSFSFIGLAAVLYSFWARKEVAANYAELEEDTTASPTSN